MRVLGIESSCDETGLAIYDSKEGLLGQVLYSQIAKHAQHGGVVPELASRDHVRKISGLLKSLCAKTGIKLSDLDGVAYTQGPGLQGALLVGAAFAKGLAFGLGVPALGVHHLEAHLMAALLEDEKPSYPFLALLISGGHTQLVSVSGLGQYKLLGESLDDAVGEAFDKTAKMMGLPYPGGPQLAKLASTGDPTAFQFARPMTNRPGLDFSFSGLKTQVLKAFQGSDNTPQTKADIAASFQEAVVQTLLIKCKRALEETGHQRLVVSGGVAANQAIRMSLHELMRSRQGQVYYPALEYCTDNGAMVAFLGWQYLTRGKKDMTHSIQVYTRKSLE